MLKLFKVTILYIILFVIMGLFYYEMEILWDGTSHWSMFMLGGICGILIGLLNEHILEWDTPLYIQAIVGLCIVLPLEFLTGYIFNIKIGVIPPIWDYSNLPLNIMGQVSLVFAPVFIIPIIMAIYVDDWYKYMFLGGDKPTYKLI